MSADREPPWSLRGFGRRLRTADRHATVVRAAQAVRRHTPGGAVLLDGPAPSAARTSTRIARLVAEVGADQPSATREIGIAGIQVWQALAARRSVRRAGAEVTIAFTDLVGFSSWALRAGDDQVLRLIRATTRISEEAITRHHGTVVKSLGDGHMAVFADTASAIAACHEMTGAVTAVTVEGYRPQLRTGVHAGYPRAVRRDYLGVDVNIAARVAAAANGGEVLVSGPALDNVDRDDYVVRRRRTFRAKGTPSDLEVFSVVPRYDRTNRSTRANNP